VERGIGTYVKASGESNGDVGDRSNDAVRIDAAMLNCKVVGEGGISASRSSAAWSSPSAAAA